MKYQELLNEYKDLLLMFVCVQNCSKSLKAFW